MSKHYFCYLTPARPNLHENVTAEEGAIFASHCDYLREQFAQKRVLQAGTSFDPGQEHFAIVIVNAASKAEATALIDADPAVEKGLLKARVTEYSVFLDHGGATQA